MRGNSRREQVEPKLSCAKHPGKHQAILVCARVIDGSAATMVAGGGQLVCEMDHSQTGRTNACTGGDPLVLCAMCGRDLFAQRSKVS